MNDHQPRNDASPSPPLEIERKYLLKACPTVPPEAEVLRIEQGYLPVPAPEPGDDDELREGRLRRTTSSDGSVTHVHTVKHGVGLVREELERTIDRELFQKHWPRTEGARLRKTRYELRLGEVLWVIDVFDDLDLVLAEAELPDAETLVTPPPWLAGSIEREVTGDADYANATLARRSGW